MSIKLPIGIIHTYNFVNISIGSPPQSVRLLPDLGSGPLWVLDNYCDQSCASSYGSLGRGNYNPYKSSTESTSYEPESISYLGGTIDGYVFSDVLSADSTFFGAGNIISVYYSSWSSLATSGFVGLGFPSLAYGNTSIYSTVYRKGVVNSPSMSIYLGNATAFSANDSPENNGVITFGPDDNEVDCYSHEQLSWVPISPTAQVWSLKINSVKYSFNGRTEANLSGSWYDEPPSSEGFFPIANESYAILDTGAALNNVPQNLITLLYQAIGLNFTFISHGGRPLCTDVSSIDAKITFEFEGGTQISVSAKDFADPGYTEDQYCWPVFNDWGSDNFLLGLNFLKNFYTVYNMNAWIGDGDQISNPMVGFAPLKEQFKKPIFPF
ncbi:hypothetical protein HDU83_009671 [Entophlyctis luteolus]|nr:hypothetical protein HDU83_009671 [Entophlyctis luteolus]